MAVSRAFPLFNRKEVNSSLKHSSTSILVEFLFVGANTTALDQSEVDFLNSTAESVRLAARIVDTPCNEMDTDHFLEVFTFMKH